MFFISLIKWKQTPTKDKMDQATKTMEELEKQGIKIQVYFTLGRYDQVAIIEAPTEKEAMKALIGFQGLIKSETMVAVPREEAKKLV